MDAVRVGTVSAVNAENRTVRVLFSNRDDTTSDWLYLLQHHSASIHVEPDCEHTHTIADSYTGGGSASTVQGHSHVGTCLTYWMPEVGQRVVCVFDGDGDGYVAGAL